MSSWFHRLKQGLTRSSTHLTSGVTAIFGKKKLDAQALEKLEELRSQADLGVRVSSKLVQALSKERFGKEVTEEEVKQVLAQEISRLLEPVAQELIPHATSGPHVVLVVGVNGTGKTTTIGKLAAQWKKQGKQVTVVAGDTFRAAAVEQLSVWAKRAHVPIIEGKSGGDAAGLAYSAYEDAQKKGVEVLIIDTAGRLHNKVNLMAELSKISRVLKKIDPAAPHTTLLVLDATTGQNAQTQAEVFGQAVPLSGLVLTKLDGTAKGGVLVSLAEKFSLPVYAVGVGEGIDDLQPFKAEEYARSLLGIG